MTEVRTLDGRLLLRALVATVAMLAASGSSCAPGEGNQTEKPVTYQVDVSLSPGDERSLELRFGADDSRWLGLPGPTTSTSGSFEVRTPHVDNENMDTYYCLVAPAEVVATSTVEPVATIPAETCLGRGTLVVPTAAVPAFDAKPDRYGRTEGGSAPTAFTGALAVSIDGCTTIGGVRVWWPDGSSIDAAGSVVLVDGRTFTNGSLIDVTVQDRDVLAPKAGACPSVDGKYVLAGS